MVRGVAAALLLGLGLVCGCSGQVEQGDDESAGSAGKGSAGKSTTSSSSPEAACKSYASTWCNKAFGCYVQEGRLDKASLQTNANTCVSVIVDHLPCSAVASVNNANYNQCIAQIKAMPCSRWNVPQSQFANVATPDICNETLSF
jgi:hypothetical protein